MAIPGVLPVCVNKVSLKTATLFIYLPSVATKARLDSYHRDCMVHEVENIYSGPLEEKSFQALL